MSSARHSHTTRRGMAKCLAYRGGKRCGRVAKIVGSYRDEQGHHHQSLSLCRACADRLGAHIEQESTKGFRVAMRGSIMQSRHYEAE